jgi:hypothetical protein
MAEKEPGTASPDPKLPEQSQESLHGETVQPAREESSIREEDQRREEKSGDGGQGD